MTTTKRATYETTNGQQKATATIVWDAEWTEYCVEVRGTHVAKGSTYHTEWIDDAIRTAKDMLRRAVREDNAYVRCVRSKFTRGEQLLLGDAGL